MDVLFCNGAPVLSGGIPVSDDYAGVSFDDRGLQYGDGVFETFRICKGEIPMWKFHQERLELAQLALKLPMGDFFIQWPSFVKQYLGHIDSGYAKLVISRGEGPRGYQIPAQAQLNWWLRVADLPESYQAKQCNPFSLTLCQHPISRQPKLAGLKHLNRLDQVMARSEWSSLNDFDEGIMFNIDGDVIEGTMSNIFWVKDGHLFTPDLSQEGIDGCVRRWLIARGETLSQPVTLHKETKLEELNNADGVFLTNSLMGIRAVSKIGSTAIEQSNQVGELAKEFAEQFELTKTIIKDVRS